ncbi:MAG: DUF447 domain-containing protein [Xanthobacteraceae bacterium]
MPRTKRSIGAVRSTPWSRTARACAKWDIRYAPRVPRVDAMPLIRETILTTVSAEGRLHITPIGIIAGGDGWIIAPFRPSATLPGLWLGSTMARRRASAKSRTSHRVRCAAAPPHLPRGRDRMVRLAGSTPGGDTHRDPQRTPGDRPNHHAAPTAGLLSRSAPHRSRAPRVA